MSTITPTSPAVPTTITNLQPVSTPLSGNEYTVLVQNGVTVKATLEQIAFESLPILPSAEILVGNASNVATPVTVSGDATLSNTGALTLDTVNSNVGSFTNASVTVNAKGLITAASSGAIGSTAGNGFVNKFRNGNFEVVQRGTSGSQTSSTAAYCADGWMLGSDGTHTITWSQQYGQLNNGYGGVLTITGASSVTDTFIKQRIASDVIGSIVSGNSGDLIPITFQIFINQNGIVGGLTPTLAVYSANAQDNWSARTSVLAATNLQTVSNGNQVVVSYTFTPTSACSNGMEVIIDFGTSLNSGSNTISLMQADLRSTPGVSIGLNNSPPVPEIRPIFIEYPICQSYLRNTYNNGTAAGSSTTGGGFGGMVLMDSANTNNYGSGVPFGVPMRSSPTISLWDRAGNSGKASTYSGGSWTDTASSVSSLGASQNGFIAVIATAISNPYLIHYQATAEL